MADGLFGAQKKSSSFAQAALTRHRLLTVNTSSFGAINGRDASTYASVDPNDPNNLIPAGSSEGGEHFQMSPETSDGRPTLGFEFCLFTKGMDPITQGPVAVAAPGGFQVTVWAMIGNTMLSDGSQLPVWASFQTLTGVQLNQLYHSFDVNTTVLRFQFGNIAVDGSIAIAFAEL
jgi:hypothetical protein